MADASRLSGGDVVTYDYIIVGGGSAGCAVAARLAQETDASIVVLEAGPADSDWRIKIPFALMYLMGSKSDWRRESAPQKHAGGRRIKVPRGKLLGGSGSINSMLWFRGCKSDFDGWNVPGWSAADVMPAFEDVEARTKPQRLGSPHPVAEMFGAALGANDPMAPPNPEVESAAVIHANLHDGRRCSAADAFLRPAMETGRVDVVTGAEADRIELEQGCARRVHLRDGRIFEATSAITLSAGSIESPMILFRSGLGPAETLAAKGIDVIKDVPSVGANLHDHPACGIHYFGKGSGYGIEWKQLWQWATAPLKYAFTRRGVLASPTVEGTAFFRAMPDATGPDAQSHFLPFKLDPNASSRYTWGAGYFADVTVCRPRSRGSLTLGKDAYTPCIDFNLLSDPYDLDVLENGFMRLREIMDKAPFGARRAAEAIPGSEVTGEALRAHIRENCGTAYHPVGTLQMGPGSEAPVAADLSFKGVSGLFVADASVMPNVTSANTNAPSMMIGWRAGKFIADAAKERKAS